MKKIKIPKKTRGEFREIMIPDSTEMLRFQNLTPKLNEKAQKLCAANVHGFMIGRSPVSNAKEHIGYRYTLCFDIKDFFDNVRAFQLVGKITRDEINECMPDGRAYQGLPTSPIVANIAGTDMDKAISRRIEKIGGNIKYTRYADDLSFSFNDYECAGKLKQDIPGIIGVCGFKINKKKTRLQDARFGNRVITGVAVGSESIFASRNVRRRLRAARHQNNKNQITGLAEWVKLKEPKVKKKSLYRQHEINSLTRIWGLPNLPVFLVPEKETTDLGDGMVISGDLIYILGPSNFGTNWKSCLKHPSGGAHLGTTLFALMSGIRVALLLSDDSLTIAGFRRHKVKARVLIYDTAVGSFYGRLYGESEFVKGTLKAKLEQNNIKYVKENLGIPVLGRAEAKYVKKTYLDHCTKIDVTINDKQYITLVT